MLLRTISALVGLAVLAGGLWGGLPWVFLLTLIAAILGIREFYRLHPPGAASLQPDDAVTDADMAALADYSVAEGIGSTESGPGEPTSTCSETTTPEPPEASESPMTSDEPTPAEPTPAEPANMEAYTEDRAVQSPEPPAPATPLPALVGAAWVGAFVIGGAAANGELHFLGISLAVFLAGAFIALLWLIAFYHGPRWPVAAAYLMGGPVYIGFLLAHALALAQVGNNFFYAFPTDFNILSFPDSSYELGRNWLIFALLTTFATDTGAYLVGRAIGRHPMAPGISPNKTWEGSVGGFAGAIFAALVLERVLNLGLGHTGWTGLTDVGWSSAWNWQPLLIGATVGIASQCGDLLESALKRLSQVKDAGSLMPGHGGILDRLDSLLITIPVVYYLLVTVLRP